MFIFNFSILSANQANADHNHLGCPGAWGAQEQHRRAVTDGKKLFLWQEVQPLAGGESLKESMFRVGGVSYDRCCTPLCPGGKQVPPSMTFHHVTLQHIITCCHTWNVVPVEGVSK